ncbi:MAG: M61 family metallopeptidase [Burkholderiales bacterium]|nr:M61 family metallopeptidase [Burkholderiales bacterium]
MVHYNICFADPAGHWLDVEMTLPAGADQRVAMPSWIPGSYLIREFARHVLTVSAEQTGGAVPVKKIDKSTWKIDARADAIVIVRYRVYAWDRSVRGCYFDASRGFVNPAACLLHSLTSPATPCTVDVHPPHFVGSEHWKCATAMTPIAVSERGFGRYTTASYDELIDHPIECSAFDEFTFEAGGVTHRFVISGRHRGDLDRLRRDCERICRGHCALFADATGRAPFPNYLFQLHVVDDGYGGLEHRASTALIAPRSDLPAPHDEGMSEGYRDLLGLISHEYFHAWNVKRIKPAAMVPYNTAQENYTQLLWLFEGFTSYYDDLMLKRVGLITEGDYLKLLGRRLTQALRTPGRRPQSAAEASFDAWIKYYRADENAVNSQFSYYVRGSQIALALDLAQRAQGDDAPTLDDVMRALWLEFGNADDTGRGVPERPESLFSRWCQRDLGKFFDDYVYGSDDPPWLDLFATLGIQYRTRPSSTAGDRGGRDEATCDTNPRTLGMQIADGGGLPAVKHVLNGSAAWQAGLSAGDTLIAIDGLRANATTLGKHLARFRAGDTLDVSYFRHDVLHQARLTVPEAEHDTVWLQVSLDDVAGKARRDRWLATGQTAAA